MSISASIEFSFESKPRPIELIEKLINSGWSINDNGHISFLPYGDGEDYNWTWCDIGEWSNVLSIIDKKTKGGETIGLALTWKETNIGGELLVLNDENKVWFSLSCNRKSLTNENNYTDFVWYLDKLVPILCKTGLCPKSIVCEHE